MVVNYLSPGLLLSAAKNAFIVYCSSAFILPILSVFQERRIWKSPLPSLSLLGHIKVFAFNVVWMGVTLVGGLALLPKFILGKFLGFDCQYEAHLVERVTAKLCCLMFICPKIEIRGEENLPPPDDASSPAPVYVANHSSQVDLGVVYFLGRRFKWISKDSVRYLPGVGLIMSLSQHVFIVRKGKNRKSVSNLYEQSNRAIQLGLPMFFFPQGTRRMAERLPFKDGAYRVAMENESQLIPVSIDIPLTCWNSWYPFCLLWGGGEGVDNLVLTVHEPIQAKKGMDKEELKKKTYDAIFSVLPLIGEEVKEVKKKK